MKYLLTFIFISSFPLSFLGGSGKSISFLSDTSEKRFYKFIHKIWSEKVDFDAIHIEEGQVLFLIKEGGNNIGYCAVKRTNGCLVGGCPSKSEDIEIKDNRYESFDMMIAYNISFDVLDLKILEYRSSNGYQITSRGWLKQFGGKQETWKYQENIQAISGATVSARNLIDDINDINVKLKEIAALRD